jgi:hypothetical protein
MTDQIKLAQYRLILDSCCGKVPKPPRRLTGIEKAMLAPQTAVDTQDDDFYREMGIRSV